jgi:enoyl-CoA hydratase/carnithine racemase
LITLKNSPTDSDNDISFHLLPLSPSTFIAKVILSREEALNALSFSMLQSLRKQLVRWANDPQILLVLLTSSSKKAFCSGGDIKALWADGDNGASVDYKQKAARYFQLEYATDLLIHRYSKPIVTFLDGWVLGGGWGLVAGAQHQCATLQTQWAMPEINIGFFPDVGSSWFLNRLPWGLTLWTALMSYRWTAEEAFLGGFAHHLVAGRENYSELELGLITMAQSEKWNQNREPSTLHQRITNCLRTYSLAPLTSKLDSTPRNLKSRSPDQKRKNIWMHLQEIQLLANNSRNIEAWEYNLRYDKKLNSIFSDDILRFRQGSPLSAHIIFEQMKRCRSLSRRQCFLMDLKLSRKFVVHSDFKEGVRALLIEKDKNPRWTHSKINQISSAEVQNFFSK